jgi:hypothetical protein
MVSMSRRGIWLAGALAALVVGCCRSGSNHSCDFTPPEQAGGDAGTDASLMCGTKICEASQVCCVTKAPLNATCIEPSMFQSLGCEKLALPCFKPTDCPPGIACCAMINADGTGTVSCRVQSLCVPSASTYVACASDGDCPAVRPTCTALSSTPQGDFKVCE